MSAQKSNPFQGFVPDPTKIPDPNTISLGQLEHYNSYEQRRLSANLNSFKRSRLFIAGCVAAALVGMYLGEKKARSSLFGADNKGGSYLDLETIRDEEHYAYNREFQRMFHLAETVLPDRKDLSEDLNADLGIVERKGGKPFVPKKSAHEKYY